MVDWEEAYDGVDFVQRVVNVIRRDRQKEVGVRRCRFILESSRQTEIEYETDVVSYAERQKFGANRLQRCYDVGDRRFGLYLLDELHRSPGKQGVAHC